MRFPGPRHRSVLDQPSLVLNRSWLPIHVTSVRHALSMLYRGAASAVRVDTYEIFDFESWSSLPTGGPRFVRAVCRTIRAPEVIVLRRFDRPIRRNVPFNRRNLLRRDGLRCQYCGRSPGLRELTMDHVVPRSQGGGTSWINCVVACVGCNNRKGGRTPEQAGLRLRAQPRIPEWSSTFRGGVPTLEEFLGAVQVMERQALDDRAGSGGAAAAG